MQISPYSNYLNAGTTLSPSTKNSTSSVGATAAFTLPGTATSDSAQVSSSSNDAVQNFEKLANMSPMDRMRANILKGMGLSESDLAAMPAGQKEAIEQKIQQLIQQQLDKKASQPGAVLDMSA